MGDAAYTTHFFSGMGMNHGMNAATHWNQICDTISDRGNERIHAYNQFMEQARNQLWANLDMMSIQP